MDERPSVSGVGEMSRGELAFFNLDRLTRGLLRHWMPGRRCHVALDLPDLAQIIDRSFGLAVVVGVAPSRRRLGELMCWSTAQINHSNRPCIFAVGDVKLAVPESVFQQAGFTAVFSPGWPSRRIVDLASRHWKSLDWPSETAEARCRRMMPFRNE